MRSLFICVMSLVLLLGCAAPGNTPAQKRAAIQQMRSDTLTRLYKQHPPARKEVSDAAGYAVFSNVGNNLLLSRLTRWNVTAVTCKIKQEIIYVFNI